MKEKKRPQRQQEPGSAQPSGNSLPWGVLEQQVVRLQKQIAQAAQRGDKQAVYDLQQRLMESEAARLLAVRRAAEENQGKDTAGIDGIKSLSQEQRMVMASTIHPKYWNHQPPLPVRRVWIPKPGTNERRPLAVLPMIDRCKQALVKLALEPEWEARFEAHSYGFRPGRGAHDAIAAIVVAIERQPMFVFDADIEAAFDHVNQAVLLDKLQTSAPIMQVITTWLRAGVMDGERYSPSETGIAQGGVLSPLLLNIALHGMEAVVTEGAASSRTREQPLLVRYADDFVILHPDLKELQQAIRRVKNWLARLGLQLHADKTRITHTLIPCQGQVGFDFLGFNIRQEPRAQPGRGQANVPGRGLPPPLPYDDKSQRGKRHPSSYRVGAGLAPALEHSPVPLLPYSRTSALEHSLAPTLVIAPSQEASRRHLATIDQRLLQLQTAPQARVIEELNPLIVGWVAYYNGVVPPAAMSRYDALIEQRLLNWATRRHPGKSREWLLNRYWQRISEHEKVFAIRDGARLRAYRQQSILKGKP